MKRKPNIHSLARLCLGIIQSDTPWSNTAQEKITNAGSAVSLRNNKAEYKTCTRSLLLPHTFNEDPPLADSLKQQRDAWKWKCMWESRVSRWNCSISRRQCETLAKIITLKDNNRETKLQNISNYGIIIAVEVGKIACVFLWEWIQFSGLEKTDFYSLKFSNPNAKSHFRVRVRSLELHEWMKVQQIHWHTNVWKLQIQIQPKFGIHISDSDHTKYKIGRKKISVPYICSSSGMYFAALFPSFSNFISQANESFCSRKMLQFHFHIRYLYIPCWAGFPFCLFVYLFVWTHLFAAKGCW